MRSVKREKKMGEQGSLRHSKKHNGNRGYSDAMTNEVCLQAGNGEEERKELMKTEEGES